MPFPAVAGAQTPDQASTQAQSAQAKEQGRWQGTIMETITTELGVSKGDVISHVRTGGTIAELADANGSSGEALLETLLTIVEDRIAEALANDVIDVPRADEIRANATERLTALIFNTHEGRDANSRNGNPGVGNRQARQLLMETVQSTLDVNRGELVSHVRTGGTLAELAEENGSSGPELEAALVQTVSDRLDEAVANDAITTERAAEILAEATERISEIVYSVHQPGNGRP